MRADEIEVYPGICKFGWNGTHQVKVKIDRFRPTRTRLDSEITVSAKDKEVFHSTLNLLRYDDRIGVGNRLAKMPQFDESLKDDLNWIDTPWVKMIHWATSEALRYYREGEPVLMLGNEPVQPLKHDLFPFLAEKQSNSIYGPGDSAKSMFVIFLALLMQTGQECCGLKPVRQTNVLWLDYETSRQEFNARVALLKKGMNLPEETEIAYRRCYQPLTDDIDEIRKEALEREIGLIVIDSFAGASNGDSKDEATVLAYIRALRGLDITNQTIDHVNKEHVKSGQGYGPTGSIQKFNQARNSFEIKAHKEEELNYIEIAAIHQKNNNGPKVRPLGYRIHFFKDGTMVQNFNVADNPVLSSTSLPLADRIQRVLQKGELDISEIADETGEKPSSIKTTLYRHENDKGRRLFVKNKNNMKWGNKY